MNDAAIWHDIECGAYGGDLAFWLALAAQRGGPVLDIGAGTGRVALALARAGHDVVALDADPELLAELERRALELPSGAAGQRLLHAVAADARAFELGRRFPLVIVPMQTVQLFGGLAGRLAFLRCALRHLRDGGVLAIAIATRLECFELAEGEPGPLPDVREHDGYVYFSQPTAVRRDADAFALERRREIVSPAGERTVVHDLVRLDRLSVAELQREAADAGLRLAGVRQIAPTLEHVGSEVVMLAV